MPGWAPEGEEPYWISLDFFCRILDLVRGRADVSITFDDGNRTDYTLALPALKERGMTAQFFVVADRIGRHGYLSGPEIRALAEAGMAIGNHGFRHHRWTEIDSATLVRELTSARDQIGRAAGTRVCNAACPFGSYNRRVLKVLRACGFRRVYTSDRGPAASGAWFQPRNTITREADVPDIQGILDRPPAGTRKMWRDLKLFVKRWRN